MMMTFGGAVSLIVMALLIAMGGNTVLIAAFAFLGGWALCLALEATDLSALRDENQYLMKSLKDATFEINILKVNLDLTEKALAVEANGKRQSIPAD
jgi:hypothetical protein